MIIGSLYAKLPCEYAAFGGVEKFSVTHRKIVQWLDVANKCGEKYNINPAILLAIASIESDGNFRPKPSSKFGIVQMSNVHIRCFGKLMGKDYQIDDVLGIGKHCNNPESAVYLSFSILSRFLSEAMDEKVNKTKDIFLATTTWNNKIGENTTPFFPYGKENCGFWRVSSQISCYGLAVKKLISSYEPWCENLNYFTKPFDKPNQLYLDDKVRISYGEPISH